MTPRRLTVAGLESLGRTQVLVLRLLASSGPKSARQLEYDWPTLTESSAGAALRRLGDKRLVDAAGWEDNTNRRTYCLTERGAEVERRLNIGSEEVNDA